MLKTSVERNNPGMAKVKKIGRPPKINKINYADVEEYGKFGLTEKEIAERLGISVDTISNYKKKYPLFLESLKKGKDIADGKVVESLFKRATGYSHPDVHISNYQGVVTVTSIIKHYPPDPLSMIFWLKNRQPQKWRDKTDVGGLDVEMPQNIDELSDKEVDILYSKLVKKDE